MGASSAVAMSAIGLAPAAFLIGLLHSRLARSTVGDLFVELREGVAGHSG